MSGSAVKVKLWRGSQNWAAARRLLKVLNMIDTDPTYRPPVWLLGDCTVEVDEDRSRARNPAFYRYGLEEFLVHRDGRLASVFSPLTPLDMHVSHVDPASIVSRKYH